MTEMPWAARIGLFVFAMAWLVGVAGWLLQIFEWRAFERCRANAAALGLVLCTRSTPSTRARFRLGVGIGRVASDHVLRFPVKLPYARSLAHPCRLPWFGRAVLSGNHLRIEARVPLGLTLFAGGWWVMALDATLIALAVGEWMIGTAAGTVTALTGYGFWNTLGLERQAASHFMRRIEQALRTN